ncbi:hypothetical protein Y025_5666 [Burkholderia pseudomallei TSV32]|nr:hypothetical protein Y025_5666 [Burkholderia pseudomallei TSV32]
MRRREKAWMRRKTAMIAPTFAVSASAEWLPTVRTANSPWRGRRRQTERLARRVARFAANARRPGGSAASTSHSTAAPTINAFVQPGLEFRFESRIGRCKGSLGSSF